MRKFLIVLLLIIAMVAMGSYIFYKVYFPGVVAEAIASAETPGYLPKFLQKKIKAVSTPVNAGAEDVIKQIHLSQISIDKILAMIDNTTEKQAYLFLDELNQSELKNTDQVFDIAKKHFPADFDVEILRKPFNENVNLKMIEKGISFANNNRKLKDIDIETAKAIAKKILLEKEKELLMKQ
jgi:hypothetical protein